MLGGKHLARAAHAGLHFVENEQHAEFLGNAAKLIEEFLRWNDVAAFALDWLENNRREFFCREDRLYQLVFDHLQTLHCAGFRLFTIGAAIAISIRDMVNAWY